MVHCTGFDFFERQCGHHFGFMHFDMYVFSLQVQLSEGVIALSCIDPRPTFPSELAIILNGYSGELLFETTLRSKELPAARLETAIPVRDKRVPYLCASPSPPLDTKLYFPTAHGTKINP